MSIKNRTKNGLKVGLVCLQTVRSLSASHQPCAPYLELKEQIKKGPGERKMCPAIREWSVVASRGQNLPFVNCVSPWSMWVVCLHTELCPLNWVQIVTFFNWPFSLSTQNLSSGHRWPAFRHVKARAGFTCEQILDLQLVLPLSNSICISFRTRQLFWPVENTSATFEGQLHLAHPANLCLSP